MYKDPGGKVRVCLVYPNLYGLGMGNLGFQMIYRMLNSLVGCVCERAFLPAPGDIEEYLRSSTELFSYESQSRLSDFDIIAFSVSFEGDYLNIPKILALAGVPVFSAERDALVPLVLAGGIAVSLNPEPLAGIADLVLVGEAEGALDRFIELYAAVRHKRAERPRKEFLKEFDPLEFIYVPALYDPEYDGVRLVGMNPERGAKQIVSASKNMDLARFEIPQSFITTPLAEFKDTFLTEIERGCGRGCRFCAAGFTYLPPRWRDLDAVKETVKTGLGRTGKVGLVGTAVSEYPGLEELLEIGTSGPLAGKGTMTLSSLRMDCLNSSLVARLKDAGYRTVTLAPEAGSERLRRVVNKGMTDDEILDTVRMITEAGFLKLKLYFLVGLPTETDSEAEEIADLALEISSIMKRGHLTLSINPFIPKPFTPFQWHGFERVEVLDRRIAAIRKRLGFGRGKPKGPSVSIKAMSARGAFFQAYISRGDRRAASFITGGKGMKRATGKEAAFIEGSVYRERSQGEVLPWDIVDYGLTAGYLWKEYQRGLEGALTTPCNVGVCFRCGVC